MTPTAYPLAWPPHRKRRTSGWKSGKFTHRGAWVTNAQATKRVADEVKRLGGITLRVVEVRQEPLLDISEADAIAEGLQRIGSPSGGWWAVEGVEMTRAWLDPRGAYIDLWDAINGPEASAANPLVWATTFEVVQQNVDEMTR